MHCKEDRAGRPRPGGREALAEGFERGFSLLALRGRAWVIPFLEAHHLDEGKAVKASLCSMYRRGGREALIFQGGQ